MKEELRLKRRSSVKFRGSEKSRANGVMSRLSTLKITTVPDMSMTTRVVTLTETIMRNLSADLKLPLDPRLCTLLAIIHLDSMKRLKNMAQAITTRIRGDL